MGFFSRKKKPADTSAANNHVIAGNHGAFGGAAAYSSAAVPLVIPKNIKALQQQQQASGGNGATTTNITLSPHLPADFEQRWQILQDGVDRLVEVVMHNGMKPYNYAEQAVLYKYVCFALCNNDISFLFFWNKIFF